MADQQKKEKEITRQNAIDFPEIEGGSSPSELDDEKKQYVSVQLAYDPSELDTESNSVKEIAVNDHQQEVSIVIEPEQNLVDLEKEQSDPVERDNITQSTGIDLPEINDEFCQQVDASSLNKEDEIKNDNLPEINGEFCHQVDSSSLNEENEIKNDDLPEINGEFCQQVDASSSNEENEIKNDVVEPEQAQFNIDFKAEENPVDIQQESDMPVKPNDDEDNIKTTQVLDDENDDDNNNNTQAESSIQQSSYSPTKVEISEYQQPRTFCSTSNDIKEDSVGKKPRKNVFSLIKKFEQMGTSKK